MNFKLIKILPSTPPCSTSMQNPFESNQLSISLPQQSHQLKLQQKKIHNSNFMDFKFQFITKRKIVYLKNYIQNCTEKKIVLFQKDHQLRFI